MNSPRWQRQGGVENLYKPSLTTMILAGLWHGANWTFVLFGAVHGVILTVERHLIPVTSKPGDAAQPRPLAGLVSLWGQRVLTFNVF
jgi:D-alanyl-lipoteichoic acid acyltransferase DltB (MBOAT superfamily)